MNAPARSPMRPISLNDKYEALEGSVYLTGVQVLVRAALQQRLLDERSGLKTGGFVSGYRGSPLGGVDFEMTKARDWLTPQHIHFQAGVNEELGATAVWGTQQEDYSDFDGVFGFWYGKSPGVDRALDVLNQANNSGTHPNGGVVAFAGDDLLAKSSVQPAQSEFALMHAEIPVFNPSDLQDVLDYSIHGIALSRFAGVWTSVICVGDTMDTSGVIDVSLDRHDLKIPDMPDVRRGLPDRPFGLLERMSYEKSLREARLPAVVEYVRVNTLNKVGFGAQKPKYAILSTGKAYRDLRQALLSLGISEKLARDLGIGIYKIAMPWPLEPDGICAFIENAEQILVVEHKRSLIESQLKEILYDRLSKPLPIFGKSDPDGKELLSSISELTIAEISSAVNRFIKELEHNGEIQGRLNSLVKKAQHNAALPGARSAYFCSGCPHSISTNIPEGARAAPGIGCHAMTELNGRTTEGQVAMGGEGVLWVGQSRFSSDNHMFANIGDGTYQHSGSLAIRQAVTSNINITYKILYNDAVAMTGGQPIDDPMSVQSVASQLAAEGVAGVYIVSENPERYHGHSGFPASVKVHDRDDINAVMEECAATSGVTAIVYDQTCAAEKRRRRKKGLMETPDRRLFINERVCEGCGDCSIQSNCISVEPLETPLGEKRRINQSSCNMDFSCVKGFCPSFSWVEGAQIRKSKAEGAVIQTLVSGLPEPKKRELDCTLNVLFTGIGGMGVTTAGAVMAMAAYLEGLNTTTLDMTGLAQKNGPVLSHIRFATKGAAIQGASNPPAGLDILLAGDLLTASQAQTLRLLSQTRTTTIANSNVAPTAEFVMNQTLSFEESRLSSILKNASAQIDMHPLAQVAEKLLGDTIFLNMTLIGMAVQKGLLPFSVENLENAIRLNGAAIDANITALHIGRALVEKEREVILAAGLDMTPEKSEKLSDKIERLETELSAYQNADYARRYRAIMDKLVDAEKANANPKLPISHTVADMLYKVMAYKDEYEVARLYSDPAFIESLEAQFSSRRAVRVMLAPPFLPGVDKRTGRPLKRAFGPWIFTAFRALSKMKFLRGTVFDPFGWTAERRDEQALVKLYQADIEFIIDRLASHDHHKLEDLARIPDAIRGYGPVKSEKRKVALEKRELILAGFDADPELPHPFLEAAE